jgi:uncharacterized protein
MNETNTSLGLNRNNLQESASPYLLQHISNPVWWQEWSDDLIKHAEKINKPLFVSVGYATCHWCHVMASEAFSDLPTAKYLNENFICIKIDREQRPDIDQFLMDYINSQNGRGGWPLNVFMTPSLKPVFAMTYAPVTSDGTHYSFLSIARKVYDFISDNIDRIPSFEAAERQSPVAGEDTLVHSLSQYYDQENGGFGSGQKFPPHSTMLYLLYRLSIDDDPYLINVCSKTLDAMRLRGLNDHLQGGIYRYCVDNEWTIPHFEKMLYDQAMALWVYSLAYKLIGNEAYKSMAIEILRCLEESFLQNGLYISGHDADTDHKEGATYIWSFKELSEVLSEEEFARFQETYCITGNGNFEGSNHLIRRNDSILKDIEEKLLELRRKRNQPSVDGKILSGTNALLAISLIQAARCLNQPDLEEKAVTLVGNIITTFWDGKTLGHSFYNGLLQKQGFLFDASALLTAVSMLYETDIKWGIMLSDLVIYVGSFRENDTWIESRADDFPIVYASWFDHPVPSSVSLAELGLIRSDILTGKEYSTKPYREPFQSDFYNVSAMISNDLFHIFTSVDRLGWHLLPANSIQMRGAHKQDCFMGTCHPLNIT